MSLRGGYEAAGQTAIIGLAALGLVLRRLVGLDRSHRGEVDDLVDAAAALQDMDGLATRRGRTARAVPRAAGFDRFGALGA